MKYAQDHAMAYESEYTYTAKDGSCKNPSGHVSVSSIHEVAAQSVQSLKDAIAQGPVSVTVEADRRVFQSYSSGVLDSNLCGTRLDHAITAVGYGTENGKDYYLVRNSWGGSWGDQGYIKIAATSDGKGICGIQQVSVWPETN
jgi:C1A family cysteine protease